MRLLRGDMAQATVYGDDPAAQACMFREAGCQWIHVVDLDGAVAGVPRNAEAVREILAAVDIPVQLGGGIRSMNAIDRWLDSGVRRVILGTSAVQDPDLVRAAARAHPQKIAVALDSRDGFVAISGWTKPTGESTTDVARRFEGEGVAAIVHTDIARDGALEGPNLEASLSLASLVDIPLIVSGGVASMEDLSRIAACRESLNGAIVGRALYDGRIDTSAAVTLFSRSDA